MSRLAACLTLTLLTLPLGACGFQPMYGSYAKAPEERLSQVEIGAIHDREGVYLRNALIDRFYSNGYPVSPRYKLAVSKINEYKANLDITTSSEATRAQLTQTTTMALYDTQAAPAERSTPVLSRSLNSVTSYNILESEFATRVSEQKARDSGLDDLARQIELNTTLYFNRMP